MDPELLSKAFELCVLCENRRQEVETPVKATHKKKEGKCACTNVHDPAVRRKATLRLGGSLLATVCAIRNLIRCDGLL